MYDRQPASLAQLVARRSHNPKVVSSILTGGIISRSVARLSNFNVFHESLLRDIENTVVVVSLAERSKAPDSSSGGAIRVGSNPTADMFLFLHFLRLCNADW